MAGAPHPLEKARDGARGAQLADEIDLADVDAELQGGRRHQRLQLAPLQPLLGIQPLLAGEAAVMGGDIRLAQTFGEMPGHPLGQPAGIDEDEGGAMALDQLGEPAVELLPDLMGHDRFQRRGRHLEGEVAAPAVARVDDGAIGIGRALRPGAHQEAGDLLDRLLGGREADPLQLAAAERREPLEGEGQMGAALVRRHGMDLVDDHAAGGRQHLAAGVRAQKDVEGFRRGHQDMGRPAAHTRPLARRGVAGAHPGPDLHIRQAAARQFLADAGQGTREIAVDVVGEGLQRRDIDDLGLIGQAARQPLAQQPVDGGEKGGERLAGARGRGDQGVAPGLDRRPSLRLGAGRGPEAALEPGGKGGVKAGERVHAACLRDGRQLHDSAAETGGRFGFRRGDGRSNWLLGTAKYKGPAGCGIKVGSSLRIPGFSVLLAGYLGLYLPSRRPGNAG